LAEQIDCNHTISIICTKAVDEPATRAENGRKC